MPEIVEKVVTKKENPQPAETVVKPANYVPETPKPSISHQVMVNDKSLDAVGSFGSVIDFTKVQPAKPDTTVLEGIAHVDLDTVDPVPKLQYGVNYLSVRRLNQVLWYVAGLCAGVYNRNLCTNQGFCTLLTQLVPGTFNLNNNVILEATSDQYMQLTTEQQLQVATFCIYTGLFVKLGMQVHINVGVSNGIPNFIAANQNNEPTQNMAWVSCSEQGLYYMMLVKWATLNKTDLLVPVRLKSQYLERTTMVQHWTKYANAVDLLIQRLSEVIDTMRGQAGYFVNYTNRHALEIENIYSNNVETVSAKYSVAIAKEIESWPTRLPVQLIELLGRYGYGIVLTSTNNSDLIQGAEIVKYIMQMVPYNVELCSIVNNEGIVQFIGLTSFFNLPQKRVEVPMIPLVNVQTTTSHTHLVAFNTSTVGSQIQSTAQYMISYVCTHALDCLSKIPISNGDQQLPFGSVLTIWQTQWIRDFIATQCWDYVTRRYKYPIKRKWIQLNSSTPTVIDQNLNLINYIDFEQFNKETKYKDTDACNFARTFKASIVGYFKNPTTAYYKEGDLLPIRVDNNPTLYQPQDIRITNEQVAQYQTVYNIAINNVTFNRDDFRLVDCFDLNLQWFVDMFLRYATPNAWAGLFFNVKQPINKDPLFNVIANARGLVSDFTTDRIHMQSLLQIAINLCDHYISWYVNNGREAIRNFFQEDAQHHNHYIRDGILNILLGSSLVIE